jgi:lysozyme
MRLSQRGAGATLGHEGIFLQAYLDPVGIWTIGGGHTEAAGGIAPRAGMIITLDAALRIFAEDMRKFEGRVTRAIKPAIIAQQHRFDALVSFDFNTGSIASGSVDDKLNRGDVDGAMTTLCAYVNGGGRRLPGLVTRRREEAAMFRSGRYPSRKILLKDRAGAQGRCIDPASIPWGDQVSPARSPAFDSSPPIPPAPASRPRRQNFVLDLFNLLVNLWRKPA